MGVVIGAISPEDYSDEITLCIFWISCWVYPQLISWDLIFDRWNTVC